MPPRQALGKPYRFRSNSTAYWWKGEGAKLHQMLETPPEQVGTHQK